MALLQDVLLKKPKFSNFDWSKKLGLTMMPGPVYPIICREMLPGQTVHTSIMHDIKTYPLQSPLYGSFRFQVAHFFVPTRLYVQAMDQNRQIPDYDPSQVKFPTFQLPDVEVSSSNVETGEKYLDEYPNVRKSSLLECLGIGQGTMDMRDPYMAVNQKRYCAIPVIGYYDIYRNYYANSQEDTFPMFFWRDPVRGTANTTVEAVDFSKLDRFIQFIVYNGDSPSGSPINITYGSEVFGNLPNPITASCNVPLGGLCMATMRPDMFTAWLSTTKYETLVSRAAVTMDVSEDLPMQTSFTINQLRFANKLMQYFERQIVAGGRYDDFVEALFGVKTSRDLCIPELLGVQTSPIIFAEVVSTASAGEGLGDLGGRGYSISKSRTVRFTASEHGYYIACATIIPNVRYSDGIPAMFYRTNLQDVYAPQFDTIGFQPVPARQMLARPLLDSQNHIRDYGPGNSDMVFYQPAWTEYMTDVSSSRGDLALTGQLNYWTLNRKFDFEQQNSAGAVIPTLSFSSYPLPGMFNYPFTNQAQGAENFILDLEIDCKARLPKGKRVMPTL